MSVLQLGASGSSVEQLQRELAASGINLNVDGDFGPRTKGAVEAFQRAHGLHVDGVVGPQTQETLASPAAHLNDSPPGAAAPTGDTSLLSMVQLKSIMPSLSKAKANLYLVPLNGGMKEAQINTRLRKAAFLAQLAHESVQLLYFEEIASGWDYDMSKNPRKAKALGNTQPGDGPRYKGRGPIQLTGRSNYIAAGRALGLDLVNHPELAATPIIGFRVSGWFWTTRHLNTLADSSDFREITYRINGGYNGYDDRVMFYDRALHVL